MEYVDCIERCNNDISSTATRPQALVLMDHYLRHRAQNADVESETPTIGARRKA